jgi:hypothetical protein
MSILTTKAVPARIGWVRKWPHWAPYAALAWSLVYAVLGLSWAVSGRGFPYTLVSASDIMEPWVGRLGPGLAWIFVISAGIPAVAVGVAMLRGIRLIRPLFITAGALLTGILLLLMTSLDLLVKVAYIPAVVVGLLTAERVQAYLDAWTQWTTIHQVLCLIGGFLWLAATITYARRSGDACLYCGRRDGPEGWASPINAARWGRVAVYVAMLVPVFYALTRYAWALGIPLGMSQEALRLGQESGTWISGLSLATFGLLGAALMLGLVQRWGEVFPRWMVGLAGRRVPMALALVPAALASVLLVVGGIGIWSGLPQMMANLAASGAEGLSVIWYTTIQVGPTLLFPLWGVALALATLGYYYRRRGPCEMCGRGTFGAAVGSLVNHDSI